VNELSIRLLKALLDITHARVDVTALFLWLWHMERQGLTR